MFQDAMDLTDTGLLELRIRLEAYANARLSPSVEATTRMRTSVMNAAHRRAALIAADPALAAADATTTTFAAERSRAASNTWRRPVAALMAGFLTLAILAGTAYAAKPGGPLYSTRIWIEMANLPADLVARAQAEISRLEARLQEAQQASTERDGPAVEAALSAYSVIVIEAADGSAGNATASAAIAIAVNHHVVILTMLVDSVPAPARSAVQNALSSSTKVLDDLDAAGPQGSHSGPGDADVSRARRPDGAKPDLSTQVDGTSPGAAAGQADKPDKTAAPGESAAPDEPEQAPDRDAPYPAQPGAGGLSKNDPTARPNGTQTPPAQRSAGPDKDGDT
jgi:hypothetical protein